MLRRHTTHLERATITLGTVGLAVVLGCQRPANQVVPASSQSPSADTDEIKDALARRIEKEVQSFQKIELRTGDAEEDRRAQFRPGESFKITGQFTCDLPDFPRSHSLPIVHLKDARGAIHNEAPISIEPIEGNRFSFSAELKSNERSRPGEYTVQLTYKSRELTKHAITLQ